MLHGPEKGLFQLHQTGRRMIAGEIAQCGRGVQASCNEDGDGPGAGADERRERRGTGTHKRRERRRRPTPEKGPDPATDYNPFIDLGFTCGHEEAGKLL